MRTWFTNPDRRPHLVTAGVMLLTAGCLPLAQHLDSSADRTRPMYADLAEMEWLQYQTLLQTGAAVPLKVADGQEVELAGEVFTASPGVTVTVRTPHPGDYCVRVRNDQGDVSRWHCLDEERPPADPSPVAA